MCAAVLKSWREAATLILVNSTKNMRQTLTKEIGPSTVISTEAMQQTTASSQELEVLVLKRSNKSSFMPDLYVFPGGMADNADFSRDWLSLFGAVTPDKVHEQFAFSKAISRHAPLFQRKRHPNFSAIPSEVAFRICAIRETFEESGVLIARSLNENSFLHTADAIEAFSFGLDHQSTMEEWRRRVIKDPAEFQTLCQTMEIVPDIWSLYDWSNWLTPLGTGEQSNTSKRFDAVFFICCLKDRPLVATDSGEMVHSEWVAPSQMVQQYVNQKIQLAPPQLYEASRLVNFSNVPELIKFLQSRAGQPLDRWMPVRIQCADAIIFVFPGDSLYPHQPDFEGEQPMLYREETLEQLMNWSPRLHRAVAPIPVDMKSGNRPLFQLKCNLKYLPHGHMPPINL